MPLWSLHLHSSFVIQHSSCRRHTAIVVVQSSSLQRRDPTLIMLSSQFLLQPSGPNSLGDCVWRRDAVVLSSFQLCHPYLVTPSSSHSCFTIVIALHVIVCLCYSIVTAVVMPRGMCNSHAMLFFPHGSCNPALLRGFTLAAVGVWLHSSMRDGAIVALLMHLTAVKGLCLFGLGSAQTFCETD